ncbi:MAG: ATP-binding cassette domain-containing protein, partial [Candidatus Heimdallarchaeaceae archaeon]
MIQADDLLKVYYDPVTEYKVAALRGLSLNIKEGQLVSIIGPSGSGKTTLINILAGLDVPTGGRVIIKGQQLDKMTERERREFRYYNIGLINQFISQNLFPRLTVMDNLMIPKRMFCLPHETAKKEVEELLELLRLKHIAKNNVEKISGGEAIRLSLGVALAKNPDILLCDEPTGQLDNMHTKEVVETIKDVNITMGKTILVFARIPDEIKRSLGIKDTVEYDLHPSKKIGLIWNPDLITREDIYHILNNPEEEYEETVDQISYEDVEPILARSFVPPEKEEPIIKISNLKKGYPSPAGYNLVLKGINLTINKGDFVFISGPSGVGKTTLFNCIS